MGIEGDQGLLGGRATARCNDHGGPAWESGQAQS